MAKANSFAVVTFNTKKQLKASFLEKELTGQKVNCEFVSSRTYDGITSYVFNVGRLADGSHDNIKDKLASIDELAHINIFFPNERLGV